MKKIITLIIASSILFSSVFTANASQGYLWGILEINTGIEVYKLENIPGLTPQSFSNAAVQKTYDEFIKVDEILRDEFINQYRSGNLSNYQMQDLVHNYENFVYYTNKTFEYIDLEERSVRSKETQRAIETSYGNMRTYYVRVQHILSK